MDDQELLQMMVVEPWERYRRADRREKLALLRHSFSMYIAHADKTYEDLHIVLDGHTELKYSLFALCLRWERAKRSCSHG